MVLAHLSSLVAQESAATVAQFSRGPMETASVEGLPDAPVSAIEPDAPTLAVSSPPAEPGKHRFWDRQNRTLFAVSAGWAAADFCVTRSNLADGGKELNPITRVFAGSTPALAANFALETGGVIGVSYLFHKTGHHKLERFTPYANISASAGAVVYGLAHR
jgi:hypothetical protein